MESTQKSSLNKVPLFCPVCKMVMSSGDDYIYYKEYNACSHCSVKYAEGNREKWKKGWRPTKKEIKNDIR
jgi:uncharacterized CHY-type Zn-finger protein